MAAKGSTSSKAASTGKGADDRARRAQGRRTEAKLLDAGLAVLAEKGYHSARVDDIVRRADVSHGTFYLYFSNKQDLLQAMAAACADDMTSVIAALGPVDPGPAGVAELRQWLADFVANYRRYGVVIRSWMEDTVADRELVRLGSQTFGVVTASLVDRIGDADPPGLDDPELAAAALLGLIERVTYFVTSRDLGFDDDDLLDTLSLVIHRGFFGGASPAVRQTPI